MSSRDRLPVHVFQSAPELIVDIVVAQAIEQLPVLHGDERLIHPFVATARGTPPAPAHSAGVRAAGPVGFPCYFLSFSVRVRHSWRFR